MVTTESDEAEARVTITEAGKENLLLRALLRRMLPLLRNPESCSETERRMLFQNVCSALEEASEDDYEPGCMLEDPWR
jgi:hypothetical protein